MKIVKKKSILKNDTKQNKYKNAKIKKMSILQSPKSNTVHNIIIKTIHYKLQQK
jgi:hypothetical protein